MTHRKTLFVDFGISEYKPIWNLQKRTVKAKAADPSLPDLIFLVEHTPVYTLGRNAKEGNILAGETALRKRGVPLYRVERGGDVTWHGPGQMVCYTVLDLKRRGLDLSRFLYLLEETVLMTLKVFGIEGGRIRGMRGVWVADKKVASIGVAIRRWITYHGVALNVNPDLSFFDWIIPCGIKGVSMCSMRSLLGSEISITEVKEVFVDALSRTLGPLSLIGPEGVNEIIGNRAPPDGSCKKRAAP